MRMEQTLGELVATVPTAAKVFHQYGLDFCCGGKRALGAACADAGLDPAVVLAAILTDQQALRVVSDGGLLWIDRPIAELVEHILERYHAPLRDELARLLALARKVEKVHAGKLGCPAGLAGHLEGMRPFVEQHLAKEEQILFPLFLAGRGRVAGMPVQVMLHEHEEHGECLKRIRRLTDDLRLPEHACATWRELYRSLAQLELELLEHVHLENNILFPRALAG